MRPLAAAARGLTAALSTLLVASGAGAQPVTLERDPAKAETLFQSAKALLDQGDWAAACPKLQASMALDPSVSTLLKIARCHEHEGKLAAAWNDVAEALRLNGALPQPEPRRRELDAYATRMLAELDKHVPRLLLRAAHPPAALRVTHDGQPLPVAALGERLPVDAGPHEIVAEAPGFVPFHASVTLTEGQVLEVDLVLAPSSSDASSPGAAPPLASPPADALPADPGRPRRRAGIGVGVLGVASLGGALALGILTLNWVASAKSYCTADFSSCDDMRGINLLNQARGAQAGAFTLLGVGVAATTVGIVLFATAPTAPRAPADPPAKPEVSATLGPLGVNLRGAW